MTMMAKSLNPFTRLVSLSSTQLNPLNWKKAASILIYFNLNITKWHLCNCLKPVHLSKFLPVLIYYAINWLCTPCAHQNEDKWCYVRICNSQKKRKSKINKSTPTLKKPDEYLFRYIVNSLIVFDTDDTAEWKCDAINLCGSYSNYC